MQHCTCDTCWILSTSWTCHCLACAIALSAIVQSAIVQRAMPIVLQSPTHRCTISGLGAGQERDSGALLTIGKKCGIGRERGGGPKIYNLHPNSETKRRPVFGSFYNKQVIKMRTLLPFLRFFLLCCHCQVDKPKGRNWSALGGARESKWLMLKSSQIDPHGHPGQLGSRPTHRLFWGRC